MRSCNEWHVFIANDANKESFHLISRFKDDFEIFELAVTMYSFVE